MDHTDRATLDQLRDAMQRSRVALSKAQQVVSTVHVTAMLNGGRDLSAAQCQELQTAMTEEHRATTVYFTHLDQMTHKAVQRRHR